MIKDPELGEMAREELKISEEAFEKLKGELEIILLQKILMMVRMLLLRYVVLLEETKVIFLQGIYMICISIMLRVKDGLLK